MKKQELPRILSGIAKSKQMKNSNVFASTFADNFHSSKHANNNQQHIGIIDNNFNNRPLTQGASSTQRQKFIQSAIKPKDIKNISNSGPIEIVPNEVIIRDIKTNQIYEVDLTVRNLTKLPRRIRIFQPQAQSKFQVDYDMQGGLAAGLSMKLVVRFDTNVLADFHDFIKIVSEDKFSQEIPLHAFAPQPQITFDPYINLGFVRVGKTKKHQFFIHNEGKKQARIELRLETQHQDVSIEPLGYLVVEAGKKEPAEIIYKPSIAGIFRGIIDVKVEGENFQKTIDVNATSVEANKFLVNEKGLQLHEIDFGDMYFGQQKDIKTVLVNNTPKTYVFSANVRSGNAATLDEDKQGELNIQTPNEVGLEQTQKIVSLIPSDGIIKPYSQLPIIFRCKSLITDEIIVWTHSFAMQKDEQLDQQWQASTHKTSSSASKIDYSKAQLFQYYVQLENKEDYEEESQVVTIRGTGHAPRVRLSSNLLNFGNCPMNQKKDILVQISNASQKMPIDYTFSQVSNFSCDPKSQKLTNLQQSTFIVTFVPTHLGKFKQCVELLLVNGQYKIPMKVAGYSENIDKKHAPQRGPEGLLKNFERSKHFVDEEDPNLAMALFKHNKHAKGDRLAQTAQDFSLGESNDTTANKVLQQYDRKDVKSAGKSNIRSEMHDEFLINRYNKQKVNDYFHKIREERTEHEKKKKIEEQLTIFNKKLRDEKGIDVHLLDEDDDARAVPPIDYEWEFGMDKKGIDSPRLQVPDRKDTLFVFKPIDKYEPMIEQKSHNFAHNPAQKIKKKFSSVPRSHVEDRQVKQTLTGENLQKIFASPKILNFGNIYVKSSETLTFAIRNDLRQSIIVKIDTMGIQELKQTSDASQIIPSSQVAGFDITFRSDDFYENYNKKVKYTINGTEFFFLLTAVVVPVKLDLNIPQNTLNLYFAESNIEMFTSETIRITNQGNASGKFNWRVGPNKIFEVKPIQGEVQGNGGFLDCQVFYHPSGGFKQEEDKISLEVADGPVSMEIVKCVGRVNEVKCMIPDKCIDLGSIPICKREESGFNIRNLCRHLVVFQIDEEKRPPFVEFSVEKGRIQPDSTLFVKVVFVGGKEEIKVDSEIQVNIRGARPLHIPFKVHTIVPNVCILQDEFDFGAVTTLGNSSMQTMTIQNDSDIKAILILDLRDKDDKETEGIDCLECTALKENRSVDESSIMLSLSDRDEEDYQQGFEIGNTDTMEESQKSMEDVQSSSDEASEGKHESTRYYKIIIKPQEKLNFSLRFSPKDVKFYQIHLPLQLAGFGKLESLTRMIKCEGVKPRFLMESKVIEFKKQIITSLEKLQPQIREISISNPDPRAVSWQFDHEQLKVDEVFNIIPDKGRIDGGQTAIIKASFNPSRQDSFERMINLYIDGNTSKPYMQVEMKGEGAYPKMFFDRREVILPVVPLKVQSRCHFRIFNDGFDNLTLKPQFPQEDMKEKEFKNYSLEVNFVEGDLLGVTKNKIRVEIVFQSPRPISFTTRLEFHDEYAHVYAIYVSGTADNSLFTNFPYLQRCPDEYNIYAHANQPITLVEEVLSEDEVHSSTKQNKAQAGAHSHSKAGSAMSAKSSKSILGYPPIPMAQLEYACDVALRWLNHNALITNIQSFPQDIVTSNGVQIYELISYISGKQISSKVQITPQTKRQDKIKLLLSQYDELIKQLKEQGCLLNTIRSHFLISYQDFILHMKLTQNQGPFAPIKVLESRFQYLSMDSWLQLFWQILKVYFLSRINGKILKTIPNLSSEKNLIPDYYLNDSSNLISVSEAILLRWVEINDEIVRPHKAQRLVMFDQDFKDGRLFASIIQNYLSGNQAQKALTSMKSTCVSAEDYKQNAEKVIIALREIGLLTHVTPQDIYAPSARENILFLMQLLHSLPHYIPKGQPVVFECVLQEEVVKLIELTNPTNRLISYYVKYEGSPDFTIESLEVKLEPKSTVKFKVTFQSRVSAPVSGRVTFTNKKETNAQAAALVFDLVSKITERKSIEIIKLTCPLYQKVDENIRVKNIFINSLKDADFKITLVHEKVVNPALLLAQQQKAQKVKQLKKGEQNQNQNQNQQSKRKNEKESLNAIESEAKEEIIIPAFFTHKERIKIRKGETVMLPVTFMPFQLETHTCKIIFCDPSIGEFQYELMGMTEMPLPFALDIRPQQPVYIDTPTVFRYQLPFENEQIKSAKQLHETRLLTSGKKEEKDQYMVQKSQQVPPESQQFEVLLKPFSTTQQPPQQYITLDGQIVLFDKEMLAKKRKLQQAVNSNNLSQVPETNPNEDASQRQQQRLKGKKSSKLEGNPQQQQIQQLDKDKQQILNQNTQQQENANNEKEQSRASSMDQAAVSPADRMDQFLNTISISMQFKLPSKEYNCFIILMNLQKTDVRVYKLAVQVCPKVVTAELEFRCSLGDQIIQTIPYVNLDKTKDFLLKYDLICEEQDDTLFEINRGKKDFIAVKNSTSQFEVKFRPKAMLENPYKAKLIIKNPATFDHFEYSLMGLVEEPLAKDHIIIKCQARKSTTEYIVIENMSNQVQNYRVETDLMNPEGPPNFSVAANQKFKYPLTVTPLLGGMYTGSITFYNEANPSNYFWYTIMVDTERPRAEKTIDLQALVRKATAFDICLSNPLKIPVVFDVAIEGEGMIGPLSFALGPEAQGTYELLFSPLRAFKSKGSLAFMHEKLGEIWYEFNLLGIENQLVRMPLVKAELGKVVEQELVLENPSNMDVTIFVHNSNSNNFEVWPEGNIEILAYSSTLVKVRYIPSDLDVSESAEISFESEEIGRWNYIFYGQGLPPTLFEETLIHGTLNKEQTGVVGFKNPFKDSISVIIKLETDAKSEKTITLLNPKAKNVVAARSFIQIPFNFIPKEISEFTACLVVYMNDKISWRYPIKGITESVQAEQFHFKAKCRELFEDVLHIKLQGLPKDLIGQKFNLTYGNVPPDLQKHFHSMFKIEPVKDTLDNQDDHLVYKVKLLPMKPFSIKLDLLVTIATGGRWKFKLLMDIADPKEDDIIEIHSPLNRTSSISFKLANRHKVYAPFTAKFTSDSDPEFSVMPKQGVLQPSQKDGTVFIVSYTPVEYGKSKQAKLIIQTDDLYWSFQVKGSFPIYLPPTNVISKLNNKLEPAQLQIITKTQTKNFLLENLKKGSFNEIDKHASRIKSVKQNLLSIKQQQIQQINQFGK